MGGHPGYLFLLFSRSVLRADPDVHMRQRSRVKALTSRRSRRNYLQRRRRRLGRKSSLPACGTVVCPDGMRWNAVMAAWQEMYLYRESGGGHGGNMAALIIHRVGQSPEHIWSALEHAMVPLGGCLQAPVSYHVRDGWNVSTLKGRRHSSARVVFLTICRGLIVDSRRSACSCVDKSGVCATSPRMLTSRVRHGEAFDNMSKVPENSEGPAAVQWSGAEWSQTSGARVTLLKAAFCDFLFIIRILSPLTRAEETHAIAPTANPKYKAAHRCALLPPQVCSSSWV